MNADNSDELDLPITTEWLKEVGFRWHQFDRQPERQWLLWIGQLLGDGLHSYEDVGIELAPKLTGDGWHCWIRSDAAGLYHRFIHIRYLKTRRGLIGLFEGMTGYSWVPENHIGGVANTPAAAKLIRDEYDRLDRALLRQRTTWYEAEKDTTRSGALPEHLSLLIKNGTIP